ncbi:hypothetical protein [Massilia genomosp. 1]|uniref:HEAT repeat domain-containing protein n=1 Tax=Massilia genomosp. 1 TaxID=2609280 RepID=A0ABX0N1I6_9BURK|nr:hypothetical protein [Massilia genomosp. 1]NHZ66228.1 hypothetical protein [Massilia genomosp. 1]
MSANPIDPLSVTPLALFAMYDLRLQCSNPESDAWCDDGEAHAIFLLDRFSDADWDALFAALDSRDSHWQHACAAMLFQAADVKRAIEVLTLLGKSADREVACCARESLGYLA